MRRIIGKALLWILLPELRAREAALEIKLRNWVSDFTSPATASLECQQSQSRDFELAE